MRATRREQVLLTATLVLLLLVGLCAATEYYVKPTISQETSCPRESCYRLDELAAKYFYPSATDVLTDNVTVILLNGTHELKGSIFVRQVDDFTLLGAGGESHVEINCKGVSSLVFDGIINLTITRITFSQCGTLYQNENLDLPLDTPHINAMTFSDVFNLKLIWVVLQNSTSTAILAINVLGASVIDHSMVQNFNGFRTQTNYINDFILRRDTCIGYEICIRYENCNQIHHKCTNKTKSHLYAVNSHKLHIHNCVLRDGRGGSMKIVLNSDWYDVELDLMNITVLNGGGTPNNGDISVYTQCIANYLVTLRDSYIGRSEGVAITVTSLHTEAYLSQLIHITNSIIDKCAAGIHIEYHFPPTTIATFPQILIDNCIITNISGNYGEGFKIIGDDTEHLQFSVVLSNVSFENNRSPLHLYNTKTELTDCRFVGNQGTPIALYGSTLQVSGTLGFENNTAYQGGAMAFYGKSYMSVSLEKNTQILFINNYAEHVGGAIFAEDINNDLCFLQLATHNSKCSDLINDHRISFVFTNNTAFMEVMLYTVAHYNIVLLVTAKVKIYTTILFEELMFLSSTIGTLCNMTQDTTQTFPSYLLHRPVSVCVRMESQTVLLCSKMILTTLGKPLPFQLLW